MIRIVFMKYEFLHFFMKMRRQLLRLRRAEGKISDVCNDSALYRRE